MIRVMVLILLGLGIYSTSNTVSHAPAFVEAMRDENVYGEWRLGDNSYMYDQGSYLFQLGHSFLYADALFSDDTEALGEVASFEVAAERARKAKDLFKRSLAADPANAHTWANYANAQMLLGEFEEARVSLDRSWALAPYNQILADRRLTMVVVLFDDVDPTITPPTERELQFIKSDLVVLQRFDRGGAELHSESSPLIRSLLPKT